MQRSFFPLACMMLLACGPMSPEEQEAAVASQQRKLDLAVIGQCAAGVTPSCISGAYSTVKDVVDIGKTVLGWVGIDLGGSGPTNQDVLNRIDQLANQNDQIQADIHSVHLLVKDVRTQIGTLLDTDLKLFVLNKSAENYGLLSGLGAYARAVQQGQTPDTIYLMYTSRTLTVALMDPILYQGAGRPFSPNYAAQAAVRAITVRMQVLQTLYPNRFLDGQVVPGIKTELQSYVTFLTALARDTTTWADAQVSGGVSSKETNCTRYRVCDDPCLPDGSQCQKPRPCYYETVCTSMEWSFSARSPVNSQSGGGYPSQAAALAARDQAIATLKSGFQQHLGIPSMQALTAQLNGLAQRAR